MLGQRLIHSEFTAVFAAIIVAIAFAESQSEVKSELSNEASHDPTTHSDVKRFGPGYGAYAGFGCSCGLFGGAHHHPGWGGWGLFKKRSAENYKRCTPAVNPHLGGAGAAAAAAMGGAGSVAGVSGMGAGLGAQCCHPCCCGGCGHKRLASGTIVGSLRFRRMCAIPPLGGVGSLYGCSAAHAAAFRHPPAAFGSPYGAYPWAKRRAVTNPSKRFYGFDLGCWLQLRAKQN